MLENQTLLVLMLWIGVLCLVTAAWTYDARKTLLKTFFRIREYTLIHIATNAQFKNLFLLMARISAKAKITPPFIAINNEDELHAYCGALTKDRSFILISQKMYNSSSTEDLEVIVAHEISHIHDENHLIRHVWRICMQTRFLVFVSVTSWLFFVYISFFEPTSFLNFFSVLILFLWLVLKVLHCSFCRQSEFRADRNAVLLTGNPHAAISMLNKLIEPDKEKINTPTQNRQSRVRLLLKTFDALCKEHPPVIQRIRAVEEEFLKKK